MMQATLDVEVPNDEPGRISESAESWDYLCALRQYSLSEGHMESNLSVVLECRIFRNPLPVRLIPSKHYDRLVYGSVFVLQFHALDADRRERGDDESVFIVNVEDVNGEKIGIPSHVWLRLGEEEFKCTRRDRYLSALGRDSRFKFLSPRLRVDREFGMLANRSGVEEAAPGDIKSAVDIVNCISNNQGDIYRKFPINKAVLQELFPRLDINIQSGAVCVGRGKESCADISDVLFGPRGPHQRNQTSALHLSGGLPFGLLSFPKGHKVGDIPESISHPGGHCGRHAKRPVNLNEVVCEVV